MSQSGLPPPQVVDEFDALLLELLPSIRLESLEDLSVEALATAAAVSPATIYRRFGSRPQLIQRSALVVGRAHLGTIEEMIQTQKGAITQLEEGFAYSRRRLSTERTARVVLAACSVETEQVLHVALGEMLTQIVSEGQVAGQIRGELGIDEVVDWLIDHGHYLQGTAATEERARSWFRTFIAPALRPSRPQQVAVSEVVSTLEALGRRLSELQTTVDEARRRLPG